MKATTGANVRVEMYGTDNGHDFKVIETRDSEVRIEYLEDGRRAWFIRTRFERDAETDELHLI